MNMGTPGNPSPSAALISQLLREDPDLRDVVAEFVTGLATRIDDLNRAHRQMDWDLLTTLAHRLKGAAGSYGYPDISKLCAEMESKLCAHEADGFADWVARLASLSRAAQAGLDRTPRP
jgi:HPt (histidine-containing phosphotransfer) domain-containing protein